MMTVKSLLIFAATVIVVAVALGVGLGLGLRRATTGGRGLSLPQLQPPITAATPAGFKARLLRMLQTASPSLQTIKTRLFSPGPADFSTRIAQVDARVAEFAKRASEFERKCLSSTPLAWTPSTLPGGLSFPMSFQCKEAIGGAGSLTLYFGVANGHAYIAELQDSTSSAAPRMAVLAKAPLDGNAVEVVQIMDNVATSGGVKSTSWLYIYANKTTQTMELSVASTVAGVGVGCGARLRTANSLIWASGVFADPFAPNPCSSVTTSICATGSSLAVAPGGVSDCQPATSTFSSSMAPALTAAALNSTATWTLADGIIRGSGFPSVESFNAAA
jgi:hypothetical protein